MAVGVAVGGANVRPRRKSAGGVFVLKVCGGDDGNRTRVRGFADRSLDHSGTSPRQLALAAPRGFEPRFTDPKSAVLPLDDGAANPPHEASRSEARKWSGRRDSNPRPSPWQGDALPTEPLPPVTDARSERGAEGQNRTDDTRLFRAVLYQLSYLGPPVRSEDLRPCSWSLSASDDSTAIPRAARRPTSHRCQRRRAFQTSSDGHCRAHSTDIHG